MTFDVLLVALAALVLSNVVLLVAAVRSGALGALRRDDGWADAERPVAERPISGTALGRTSEFGRRVPSVADRPWAPDRLPLRPTDRPLGIPAVAVLVPEPAPPNSTTPGAGGHWGTTAPALPVEDAIEVTRGEVPTVAAAVPLAVSKALAVSASVAVAAPSGRSGAEPDPEAEAAEAAQAPAAEALEAADPSGGPEPSGTPASPGMPNPSQARSTAAASRKREGRTSPRRGRRFTLPSIEVDHARTERVVLSLLSGDDEPAPALLVDAWERLLGAEPEGAGPRSAVVVAVAIDGLDQVAEASGRDAAELVVGGVLDAIRRSARASDRVASVGRGHFRVLLVDADTDVAARFVSRVRDAAERRLSLAPASVAVVAGWAEATSAGHLEGAVRAADEQRRRNAAALSERSRDRSPA